MENGLERRAVHVRYGDLRARKLEELFQTVYLCVDNVVASCTQNVQAVRILWAQGMAASIIQVIFNAAIVIKLTSACEFMVRLYMMHRPTLR